MTSLIWLAVLAVAGGCLISFLEFYAKTIAVKMVSVYLEYDSAFYSRQKSIEAEASLIEDLVRGEYGPAAINYINRFKINATNYEKFGSDYMKRLFPGYPYNDADIIHHGIKNLKETQNQHLRNLIESWMKMIKISSKARIVNQLTVISHLESLLIENEKVSFTMTAYDQFGQLIDQPSVAASLRWELEMLFKERRIPLKKNYKITN